MTSNKPYFIRALYEWILDNNYTPHLLIDATLPYVKVPQEFISEGKIILNILPSAIFDLIMSNDWITFSAKFRGVSQDIEVPMGAIMAIYAQENGQGMGFEVEPLLIDEVILLEPSKTATKPNFAVIHTGDDDAHPDPDPKSSKKPSKKATLKIIK